MASRRLANARFLLGEFTGSFGDMGLFVPLVIGMVQVVGYDAGTILVVTGVACVAAGVFFRNPMAVQPMKAIAALAIAGSMNAGQASVAGLAVGLCVVAMAGGGVVRRLNRLLPESLVGALQMSVGVTVALAGARMVCATPSGGIRPWLGMDGLLVAVCALGFALLFWRRLPVAALALVSFGFLGAWINAPELADSFAVSVWRPSFVRLQASSLAGVWLGALPQLPLTVLNTVFAISLLSARLCPETRDRTTPARFAWSLGAMNAFAFALGGIPLCHGSSGMAAQHRFGGRTGLCAAIRGATLVAAGLFFSGAALAWMTAFPSALLGVFLILAGVNLGLASRCWEGLENRVAAATVALAHALSGMLAIAIVAGWIACALLRRFPPEGALANAGDKT